MVLLHLKMESAHKNYRYNQYGCVDEYSMLGMMKIEPEMAELCTFRPNAVRCRKGLMQPGIDKVWHLEAMKL